MEFTKTNEGPESNLNHQHTRRHFCAQTCRAATVAAFAGGLGVLLEGCGSPTSPSNVPALPTINATQSNGVISLTVDASSALATLGSAALVQSTLGSFLVARTGQSSFTALTAICTHQGCTITGYENQTYVCPCHGSQYDTSGRVLQGPAPSALRQYSNQFNNNELAITT